MLKRTKGYILLTLLVVTGLASQVSKDTLTVKERRNLVTHLKNSRAAVINNVKDLSQAQLSFKPVPGAFSIKECLAHLASSEEAFWIRSEAALKRPPAESKGSKRTDAEMFQLISMEAKKLKISFAKNMPVTEPGAEIVNRFKESRGRLITYVKTTTEDVRSHGVTLSFGTADLYQLFMAVSIYTLHYAEQIEQIKMDPAFPK